MMYLLGVLIAAVGIAVSIALHEIGHLVPAKIFGVRCTQYMVGFGKTLWSRTRGETEYGLKAVPLGGYVRMIGMFPPRPQDHGKLRRASSNPMHLMVEQAREDSLEEIQPGDEGRAFYQQPVWQRLIIMSGGPLMNLAIAAVLVGLLLTVHGVAVVNPTISKVSPCADSQLLEEDCGGGAPSPARAAGLQVGDTFISVDGTPVSSWPQTSYAIQHAGSTATLVVERDGQRKTVTAHLVRQELPLMTEAGTIQVDDEGQPVRGEVSFLGATPTLAMEKQPVTAVPGYVGDMFTGTAGVVLTLPQRLVDISQAAFGSEERDPNGPMSVVGVGRVAGEVADGGFSDAPVPLGDRMWFLVSLIASLNMALFVFNLIPLLPLDGGHIAGGLWEAVKKGWAKARGLPMPGPVDTAKALPVAYAVAIGLLGMTALLVYADIVRPISLG